MEGIVAVAFLVGCTGSLLVCEDLPASPDRFADMEACRAALPALVRRHEGQESGLPVVMGRCQLMLRPAPAMLPPNRGGARRLLAGTALIDSAGSVKQITTPNEEPW